MSRSPRPRSPRRRSPNAPYVRPRVEALRGVCYHLPRTRATRHGYRGFPGSAADFMPNPGASLRGSSPRPEKRETSSPSPFGITTVGPCPRRCGGPARPYRRRRRRGDSSATSTSHGSRLRTPLRSRRKSSTGCSPRKGVEDRSSFRTRQIGSAAAPPGGSRRSRLRLPLRRPADSLPMCRYRPLRPMTSSSMRIVLRRQRASLEKGRGSGRPRLTSRRTNDSVGKPPIPSRLTSRLGTSPAIRAIAARSWDEELRHSALRMRVLLEGGREPAHERPVPEVSSTHLQRMPPRGVRRARARMVRRLLVGRRRELVGPLGEPHERARVAHHGRRDRRGGARGFYAARSCGAADGTGVALIHREKSVSPMNSSTIPMNSA